MKGGARERLNLSSSLGRIWEKLFGDSYRGVGKLNIPDRVRSMGWGKSKRLIM